MWKISYVVMALHVISWGELYGFTNILIVIEFINSRRLPLISCNTISLGMLIISFGHSDWDIYNRNRWIDFLQCLIETDMYARVLDIEYGTFINSNSSNAEAMFAWSKRMQRFLKTI